MYTVEWRDSRSTRLQSKDFITSQSALEFARDLDPASLDVAVINRKTGRYLLG